MEQSELGLAHVGLGEADVRRLRAMMMLALADGSLRARWTFMDAGRANVVILGAELIDQLEHLAQGDRLVAVLAGASDNVPPGTRTLSWPIRVEPLIALLKMAEEYPHINGAASPPDHPLIQLAELLRPGGRGATESEAWRVDGLSRAPIYIVPRRRQIYCAESLRSVHRFDVRNEIGLTPLPLAELPVNAEQPKPIVMLQWSVGLLSGTLGLLPWLNPSATLRLQRFPEFQILHHEPVHRRLAAAFSRPVAGIDAAVELTTLDRQAVCSFVNGAELCGYLRTSDQPAVADRAPARAAGGSKRGLVQLLRRALGIEAVHG